MARLLVNNTEQIQPDDRDDTIIILFCRRAEDPTERIQLRVFGFEPRFYVLEEEARRKQDELIRQDSIDRIDYDVDKESFKEQNELARVVTPYPQDVRNARDHFDEHWSADVPFTNRFRVDTEIRAEIEVPDSLAGTDVWDCHWREVNAVEPDSPDANPGGNASETTLQDLVPRTVTLDIEADDRNGFPEDGEERVLSVVAHDNYRDEVVAWYDCNGRHPESVMDSAPDEVDRVRLLDKERDMLVEFAEWFNDVDPDLVTGWNVDGFDIPYLIDRFGNLGIGADTLSPLGWSGNTSRGPRIKGRTVYDLLTVYKKNQFTELRSYSLDDIAREELGEEKVTFDGSYYELYEEDPERFIKYNARDVTLTVRINREAGVIEFRDVLRREVGVDFEDSYDNKDFVDMMCRRALKEMGRVGPTRPEYGEAPESDYEGAQVFDAYKGVAHNVVGIDVKSLYPYTMAMLNASPETKIDEFTERPFNVAHAANDQEFRLDKDGLFKQLVDDAISLKADYKERRNNAETDEEYEYWEVKYNTAKTITNSLYGVTGWERFFLYDEDVAEAVTLTGQAVIKRTAEYTEESGFDVLYGDTDSVYMDMPDDFSQEECLQEARAVCENLNGQVYPDLAEDHGIPREDNLWEIEVEAHMETYFQAGKKKRYAYLATWKDGRQVENPKPSITGFESRRSDTSQLTVETQEAVIDAILHGREDEVSDIIFEAAQQIEPKEPDWELIGIPGGLQQNITDDPDEGDKEGYYAVSEDSNGNTYPQDAHPRAAYNANQILGTQIGSGDKPKRVYLRPHWFDEVGRNIDVIGFNEPTDMDPIEDEVTVDVGRMTATLLTRPLDRIGDAVGVDTSAAVRGQEQTNLGAF